MNQKKKWVAIILYIFLAPLSVGDYYLGYKESFKHQMIRIVSAIFLIILSVVLKQSIFLFIGWILWVWIFVVQIINFIKGLRILFGNIKTDAFGLELL